MNGDPTLELTGVIVPRLKTYPELVPLIAGRVYDPVPAEDGDVTATFPYVSIGPSFEFRDDADCIDGVQVAFRIEAWSRKPGYPEVLRIAGAVVRAIHEYEVNLPTCALELLEHVRTDKMRDPDGITSHAVVEFRAVVQQP